MPVVRKKWGGYVIISRLGRRRYITHQLDHDGVEWLAARHADMPSVEGLQIDVPTLIELKELQYAYTGRKNGHHRQPPPKLNEAARISIVKPPIPAPPAPKAPAPAMRCPVCHKETVEGAAYCRNCGHQMSEPAPKARPDAALAVLVGALFLAFLVIVYLVFTSRG